MGWGRYLAVSILAGSLLAPGIAGAQSVIAGFRSAIYQPLPSIPNIRDVTPFDFSSADDGTATLPIPFTYRYLTRPYDEVEVSTNGAIGFGASCCSAYNGRLGSTSSPNNFIAVWWDDLVLDSTVGHASYGTFGDAPNRVFVIEVRDWEHYSPSGRNEGVWQVRLHEGAEGQFELFYDGTLSAAERYSATVGFEGPAGDDVFTELLSCGSSCDHEEWTSELLGMAISVQVVPGPELVGTLGDFGPGALPGASASGQVTLQNLGSTSTGTVTSRLYMSLDSQIDASDVLVATLVVPDVPAGGGPMVRDIDFTVPMNIAAGDYVLIFHIDAPNEHAEGDEDNNVLRSDRFFSTTGPPLFLQTARRGVWVPLVNLPGIVGVTDITFTRFVNNMFRPDDEDADAIVPLPFDYNYLGQRFAEVSVGTSGYFAFGDTARSTSNTRIGSTGNPNNMIAAWWDDLVVPGASGYASYGVIGTSPNRIVVIEVRDWEKSSFQGRADGSHQLWLYEGPTAKFEVRYRGNLSAGESYSATAGWEGPEGDDLFGAFDPCSAASFPYCTHEHYPSLVGRVFSVQKATQAELTATFGRYDSGALPGASFDVEVFIENRGVVDTGTVTSTLYLSTDDRLDPTDTAIGTVLTARVDAGAGAVTSLLRATVPANTRPGSYTLILEVDSLQVVPEVEEGNNVAVAAGPFVTAYDVSVSAVSIGSANIGQQTQVTLTVENGAVRYAGPVQVRLHASAEQIYDLNDPLLGSATITLAGDATETLMFPVTLPISVRPGNYFPIVVLDAANALLETDDFNNVGAGAQPFAIGPEFSVEGLATPPAVTPGAAFEVTTRLRSFVGNYNPPVPYRLYLSDDAVLDPSDVTLGNYTVSFASGALVDDVRNPTFPTRRNGVGHYVIAEVDPAGTLVEIDETNNVFVSPARIVSGPDFSVATVGFSPGTVRAGVQLAVDATLVADLVAFTGTVAYTVWLAADPTVVAGHRDPAPTDVRLVDGIATFAGQPRLDITATIDIGPSLPIADWSVFVQVDSDAGRREPNDRNNWSRALNPLRIQGPNLRVSSVVLPPQLYLQTAIDVEITFENDGPVDAPGFGYAFYISETGPVEPPAGQFRVAQSTGPLAARGQRTLTDTIQLPSTTPGRIWLGIVVDHNNAFEEVSETDNLVRLPGPVDVVTAGPDLTARITRTGTRAVAGQSLSITRALSNDGVAAAPAFVYRYYLSANPTIATDDAPVGNFNASLGVGEMDESIDGPIVPTNIPDGSYYLGIIADPDDVIAEVREDNNASVGPRISVTGPRLAVVTEQLPAGTVGVRYSASAAANAGPFRASWSLVRGRLPTGVALDTTTGTISGSPRVEGEYTFTLSVSTGAATAQRELTISIAAATTPLLIDDRPLPVGRVGSDYCTGSQVKLTASGGVPPYRWTIDGAVPDGLSLTSEGSMCGTPLRSGDFTVLVRAEDAVGAVASRVFTVRIDAGTPLTVTTAVLPSARTGEGYSAVLGASGGRAPYRWDITTGALPEGVTLAEDGTLSGTPTQTGANVFTIRVRDATDVEAMSQLSITVASEVPIIDDEGCSCAVSAPSRSPAMIWLMVAGLLVVVRRRRYREM